MADRREACFLPGAHEFLDMRPAIERHAERVGPEDAVEFAEGGSDPAVLMVVRHAAPGAVAVAADVRRVGHHQVNAGGGDVPQEGGAVTLHQ